MTQNQKEYILCAAIHYDNGLVYNFHYNYGVETGFVLCGYRHPYVDTIPQDTLVIWKTEFKN